MPDAMDAIQQKGVLRVVWTQVQLHADLLARHAAGPATKGRRRWPS